MFQVTKKESTKYSKFQTANKLYKQKEKAKVSIKKKIIWKSNNTEKKNQSLKTKAATKILQNKFKDSYGNPVSDVIQIDVPISTQTFSESEDSYGQPLSDVVNIDTLVSTFNHSGNYVQNNPSQHSKLPQNRNPILIPPKVQTESSQQNQTQSYINGLSMRANIQKSSLKSSSVFSDNGPHTFMFPGGFS